MEWMFNAANQWIESGSIVMAAAGSFVGGALTALNPCVLVMVPLLIGFIGGMGKEITVGKSFLYTLVFILGFSVELALIFTVGAALSDYLRPEYMVYVVAAVCVLLGLHFMEVFQIPLQFSQDALPKYGGLVGAALFGFMFGIISLPCTGPALLLILSIIPVKGNLFGGVMMTFYGIGHCILILVVGTSAGAARHILSSKRIHGANSLVKKSAGALLTILGVYILFGEIAPKFGLIL